MKRISVVIPVYNEENTIRDIIKLVDKAPLPKGYRKEIIIVDDASQDNTRAILKQIRNKNIILH